MMRFRTLLPMLTQTTVISISFWAVLSCCAAAVQAVVNPPKVTDVLSSMKNGNYDKWLHPMHTSEATTIVEATIMINKIFEIQTTHFMVDLSIVLKWYELDFGEELSKLLGPTEFAVHDELIGNFWTPPVIFTNALTSSVQKVTTDNKLLVFTAGNMTHQNQSKLPVRVELAMRTQLKIACKQHLRRFPFDSQNCTIQISLMGYRDEHVILKWDSQLEKDAADHLSNGNETSDLFISQFTQSLHEYRVQQGKLTNFKISSFSVRTGKGILHDPSILPDHCLGVHQLDIILDRSKSSPGSDRANHDDYPYTPHAFRREEIREMGKQIEESEKELRNIGEKIEENNETINQMKTDVVRCEEAEKILKHLKEKMKERDALFKRKEHESRNTKENKATAQLKLAEVVKQIESMDAKRKETDKMLRDHARNPTHEWIEREKDQFGKAGGVYDFKDMTYEEANQRRQDKRKRFEHLQKTINPKAMTDLQSALNRVDELKTKIATLEKDKQSLLNAIKELDIKKEDKIWEAYRKVTKDFGNIFSTLLPVAEAKLRAADGKDVLKGIEVRIGFNGNWKDSLQELSGGQRSLVALSLVLAMLKFKLAPIYILDEVDAALDVSHTQNIGSMIKQHFTQSQFIVVSLKERMFNNVNTLFRTKFIAACSTVSKHTNYNQKI